MNTAGMFAPHPSNEPTMTDRRKSVTALAVASAALDAATFRLKAADERVEREMSAAAFAEVKQAAALREQCYGAMFDAWLAVGKEYRLVREDVS